jgi:putative ABC transport system substrate-binding protein
MQRRDFITLLGGAAAAWPLTARAQQASMPVVGWLGLEPNLAHMAAFRQGLREQGFVEDRNVAIDVRVAERYDQLPALASELVRRRVAVIHTYAGFNAAQAAQAATSTIPIVFTLGADPVHAGLVASLNRPGGNITGVSFLGDELGPKRLELARELAPQAALIGILANPTNASDLQLELIKDAARQIGQALLVRNAGTADEIDTAYGAFADQRVGVVILIGDAYLASRSSQIVVLAARHAIPTIFFVRTAVQVGGLVAYSDDRNETNRLAGVYAGRILKGEKPADLPVLQPTKFEFVINLRTAKALGVNFPPSFQLRATEVIE